MATTHTLYELDVRLRDIAPPIWRTLEVPGRATLEDVHFAIQLAMGWNNSHLHQFVIGKVTYGMTDVDEFEKLEDERAHALQDVAKAGATFVYEYDFGDGWEHDITVKRVATAAKAVRPRCVAGARACPPDDCGGPGGYEQLLAALADPDHEDHARMKEWVPARFAPERFTAPARDLTRAIQELRELADGDDDEADDHDLIASLPQDLVNSALALAPMQRASLVALLAGSLATDLTTVVSMLDKARVSRGHRRS